VKLRELVLAAVHQHSAWLRFTRDGEHVRLVHNSVSFVSLEKD
jgi:hypothetical protein